MCNETIHYKRTCCDELSGSSPSPPGRLANLQTYQTVSSLSSFEPHSAGIYYFPLPSTTISIAIPPVAPVKPIKVDVSE